MKKIKILLMSAMLAFTLVAVLGFGLKVSAVTIDETYTFDLTKITSVAAGATQDVVANSSADPSRQSTMTVAPLTVAGTTRWKASNNYLEVQCKTANFKEQFIFNTEADAVVTISVNTGGSSKTINYNIYDGESTTPATTSSTIASGSEKAFSFDFTGAGKHIIEFYSGTTAPTSNLKIYSISLATSYVSSETPEQIAEATIDRIGEVTYSDDSRNLIAAATNALEGLDTSAISNYSIYTTAVSAFDSLATAKKDAFIDAVAAIGTVTKDSGLAIQNAVDKYNELLETEQADANVITSKESLRIAQDEYAVLAYDTYDKKLIADTLDVHSAFQEKTQLGNSIFSAYTNVSIDANGSKIQDGTTYTKRIKLGGTGSFKIGSLKNVISFEARTLGTLKVVCVSASNKSERTLKISKDENAGSTMTAVMTAAEATVQSVEITQTGVYYIGSTKDGINILSLEFVPTPEPTPVASSKLVAQFADDTTKQELRLLGTLVGVEDLTKLTDVKFTLTLNKTVGEPKVAEPVVVNTLYKAVTGLEGYAGAANTYYAVYVITGIQDVVSQLNGSTITATLTYTYNGEIKTLVMENAIDLIVKAAA